MLRTTNELTKYAVEAADGQIGYVTDLLFDDETWSVRFIVVETGGILRHHKVLIGPEQVRDFRLPEETMVLDLTKAEVEESPGIDMAPPVSMQHTSHERPSGQKVSRHLRSSNEVSSYKIRATDSEMGDVHGLIVETATWKIRYVIVDTGEWLTGKLVLLGPVAIAAIDWSSQTMKANATADAIRHSPAYDETAEISRDYEAFLHDYYDWPHYWR